MSDIDWDRYEKHWETEEAPTGDYSEIPDGNYEVNVDSVEITTSKAGNDMLLWTLQIVGPKCAGRKLFHRNMFLPNSFRYLKKDLAVCNVTLGRLSELPGKLDRLLDCRLSVTKKTKGEYENIYLNRQVAAATPQDEPGDIPF